MIVTYNILSGLWRRITYIVLFGISYGFFCQSIAADSWKATIESAVEKNASIPFSATVGIQSHVEPSFIQREGNNRENSIAIKLSQGPKMRYFYLLKDGNMYCSIQPFASSKRIAIDKTLSALDTMEYIESIFIVPKKLTELINELDAVDYTDLGDIAIGGVQCRGHQIEFYGDSEDMEKIRTALWSKNFPLDRLKEARPNDPYFFIPCKYDLLIGKKDGFLYGWRVYIPNRGRHDMLLANIMFNPIFPTGTFALPEDCEIETIDDEEELEIFFKTQRTSLSKRITTKTLRFFTSNGVYVVL